MIEQNFDVRSVGSGFAPGNFYPRTVELTSISLGRTFLGPVDLLAHGVGGHSDAPPGLVATVEITSPGLNERFDLRTVDVGAHHAHSFAIAPVELTARLIEMQLLRGERGAAGNNDLAVLSVQIRALDGAVV